MAGVQEKTLASRLAYERLQADKMAADVKYEKKTNPAIATG